MVFINNSVGDYDGNILKITQKMNQRQIRKETHFSFKLRNTTAIQI